MKIKKALITLPLIAILLTGCVGNHNYKEEDYLLSLYWKDEKDFRILQLGDIHLSQSDVHEEHFQLISKIVDKSNPDLIVINGDLFTYADKHVVNKVFSYFNSLNIRWTFTFGNHDDQGYYSDTYIQRLLGSKQYNHSIFLNLEDDDVTGRSNFVINLLKDKDHSLYQVYLLDSNNYNFDTMEYDFIKQDQIEWYKRMVKYSKNKYGTTIPSSMYLHIGFTEFGQNWESRTDSDFIIGDTLEGEGSPSKDNGFYTVIKELGSTKSVHCNHDHANDAVFKLPGDDIYLVYGVHSTNRIYCDNEGKKIGGSILNIDRVTKELTFENYYATYDSNEVSVITSKGAK